MPSALVLELQRRRLAGCQLLCQVVSGLHEQGAEDSWRCLFVEDGDAGLAGSEMAG